MEDVVRDLLFEPADLDEWVQGGEEWGCPLPPLRPAGSSTRYAAHSGIHEAARATLADIQSCGHLMDLVQGPTARGAGYRVVVCGHSLGAGCAFLISLYLKKFFPSLRCLAFSPPGGLATAELCAGTQDWCTSTVCGKEMIPRLTLATFERVRDELVACAARCRRPKVSLMLGWLTGRVWADSELFYSDDELPDEPRRWLERYRESLAATAAKRAYVETAAKFGPPGKVMYLKPTGVKHKQRTGLLRLSTKTDREYRCQWADGQELMEKGVLLSGRMMKDHMPDYCLGLLQRLAEAAAAEASTASISDAVGESEVGRVSAQVPGQARPSFDGDDRSS